MERLGEYKKLLKIDKQQKIIGDIITTGNFYLSSKLNINNELSAREINNILIQNQKYQEARIKSKKLLEGFLVSGKVKEHITILIALELMTQDDKFISGLKSYIKFLVNYDNDSRTRKLVSRICQVSDNLKKNLVDKETNTYFIRILQILSGELKK